MSCTCSPLSWRQTRRWARWASPAAPSTSGPATPRSARWRRVSQRPVWLPSQSGVAVRGHSRRRRNVGRRRRCPSGGLPGPLNFLLPTSFGCNVAPAPCRPQAAVQHHAPVCGGHDCGADGAPGLQLWCAGLVGFCRANARRKPMHSSASRTYHGMLWGAISVQLAWPSSCMQPHFICGAYLTSLPMHSSRSPLLQPGCSCMRAAAVRVAAQQTMRPSLRQTSRWRAWCQVGWGCICSGWVC